MSLDGSGPRYAEALGGIAAVMMMGFKLIDLRDSEKVSQEEPRGLGEMCTVLLAALLIVVQTLLTL